MAEAILHDPAEEHDRESLWSVGGDLENADDVEEETPFRHPGVRSCQLGFRSLDDVVQLCDAFEQRGCLRQNVPRFLRGPFRRALRVALEEILKGARTNDTVTEERGWKLFLMLPRMLLHRPGRGRMVSKRKLVARFEMFVRGECNPRQALVYLGELSAARQALEGAEVAPGSIETLNALRKRPAVPREVCPPELIRHRPEVLFALDEDHLNKNLRSAKRGAAGGPSGMTVEHLQPLLDHPKDLRLFFQVAERLARGQVPQDIQAAIRMGRLTVLRKAEGGVRRDDNVSGCRWWLTDCLCSAAGNWQSTPRWCARCTLTADHGEEPPRWMGWSFWQPGGRRNEGTLSSLACRRELDWSSLLWKLGAGFRRRRMGS